MSLLGLLLVVAGIILVFTKLVLGIILIVLGFVFILAGSTTTKTPKNDTTLVSGYKGGKAFDRWRALSKLAQKEATDLGSTIYNHADDPAQWDTIIAHFDRWLTAEETAAAHEPFDNPPSCHYANTYALFRILARRHMFDVAETFIQRLTKLGQDEARENWSTISAEVREEEREDQWRQAIEQGRMLEILPDMNLAYIERRDPDGLREVASHYLTLKNHRNACAVLDNAIDITTQDNGLPDKLLVFKAQVLREASESKGALLTLLTAYPYALTSGTKSRPKAVQTEMRKTLKALGAPDPSGLTDELLSTVMSSGIDQAESLMEKHLYGE